MAANHGGRFDPLAARVRDLRQAGADIEVVRVARRWKLDRKIQALYVDYVQRIQARQPETAAP